MKEWRSTFHVPILDASVTVFVTDNADKTKRLVTKYIRDNMKPEDYTDRAAVLLYHHPQYAIIFCRSDLDANLLAHEVTHLCIEILTGVGHRLKVRNDEILALLSGWMSDKLSKLLLRNGKSIR